MNGLLRIALKLLVADKGKFFTLITGITFAVFLMMQMTSTFSGIIKKTSSDIENIGAKMWVMDKSVKSARDNFPLPNYILDAVRSINGVKFALPIYFGSGSVRLSSGTYQSAAIIGLDDTTLFGRPQMISGEISSIYNDDSFLVVKDADYVKLNSPKIGTVFEVNDHRGVVTGLAKTASGGIFGTPTLYTTYNRAIKDLPTTRFTISYVLVEPNSDKDIEHIRQEVDKLSYLALTKEEFITKNADYYVYKTGIGTNVLIMTVISFIIGLSIAGQTFYTFVLENLEKFGALKAIGAKKNELIQMLLFQAGIVGFLGYGFGVFLSSVLIALAKLHIPDYASIVTFLSLSVSFIMVIIIVAFSSYIGIRKVIKIEPFDIFRG
jgi:putative ABC transport system permease protein